MTLRPTNRQVADRHRMWRPPSCEELSEQPEPGTLVLFDRRSDAADIEERTRFEAATTDEGYDVLVLRA